ncbi:hypothetical protein OA57_00605 [Chelonobacter oris]|uniref:Uncharacterized protein n=1 Tax=Chelonobacter oris TaxID=505317 RepID=A0A0A3BDJ0_9PAST|nr:RidA family protein [Chelonobacter oris]KGQ71599.1 hypothetical protein OA57_00605 [Chelonobacter oris]
MKQIISTSLAPAAIGPYVQAVKTAGWVYISGCIPVVPETGNVINGTIEAQTKQVLNNLSAVLHAAGAKPNDIVKTTCFLKNMADFTLFNQLYSDYFAGDYPARSCVEVARLPKDVLVEIEAVAYLGRN